MKRCEKLFNFGKTPGQPHTTEGAATVPTALSDAVIDCRAEIKQCSNEECPESNAEAEHESLMLETFYQSGGSEAILSMTSSIVIEFMKICNMVGECVFYAIGM